MAGMSRIAALKSFFNTNTNRPVENAEMMSFWKGLTDDEKQSYSTSAAQQLGIELAEVKA